ncbi:MAG: diiron oxygenase [Actinomycetota bacterium]
MTATIEQLAEESDGARSSRAYDALLVRLSFARNLLQQTVPNLGRVRRARLAVGAPIILGGMAAMMLRPSRQLARRYEIPKSVLVAAYRRNVASRAEARASMHKVRGLWRDLGLLGPLPRVLWRALGLWDDDVRRARGPAKP